MVIIDMHSTLTGYVLLTPLYKGRQQGAVTNIWTTHV